jgi:hypothetical protein
MLSYLMALTTLPLALGMTKTFAAQSIGCFRHLMPSQLSQVLNSTTVLSGAPKCGAAVGMEVSNRKDDIKLGQIYCC